MLLFVCLIVWSFARLFDMFGDFVAFLYECLLLCLIVCLVVCLLG